MRVDANSENTIPAQQYTSEVLIIGGGLAGMVTALELLDTGRKVMLLDRDVAERFGGLAKDAFGGMALSGTPQQKLSGIHDMPKQLLREPLSTGGN